MEKKKYESDKLIRVDTAIYILNVSPQQFHSWREESKFQIKYNKNGKPCITENDLKKLAYSGFVKEASYDALLNHIERRQNDEITNQDSIFKNRTKKNVEKYRQYISTLERIHSNYQNRMDLIHSESALVAAYMLHAKVLNLLNMACLNLENHYWYSSLLLRPIDEAIDLAEYFLITENTDIGKKHLKAWFRENKAPPHSICRKTISKYMGTLLGKGTTGIHEETLADLYGSKSKPVHPTHHEILMVLFKPRIRNRQFVSNDFDYGPCSNLRELFELSLFFQSSIWSTVQGFLFCFQEKLPLSKSDTEILFSLNKKFEDESPT